MKFDLGSCATTCMNALKVTGYVTCDKTRLQFRRSNFGVCFNPILSTESRTREIARRNERINRLPFETQRFRRFALLRISSPSSRGGPSAGSRMENRHVLADPPVRGGMNVGARQDE